MYLRHSYPVVVKDVDSLKVILESMARDIIMGRYVCALQASGNT